MMYIWICDIDHELDGKIYQKNDIHPQADTMYPREGMSNKWKPMLVPDEFTKYIYPDKTYEILLKVVDEGEEQILVPDHGEPAITAMKHNKIKELHTAFDRKLLPISSKYPHLELLSFFKAIIAYIYSKMTDEEKAAVITGEDLDGYRLCRLIVTEAGTNATIQNVNDVVNKILNNSAMFGEYVGTLIAGKNSIEKYIEQVDGTYEEVKAVLDQLSL